MGLEQAALAILGSGMISSHALACSWHILVICALERERGLRTVLVGVEDAQRADYGPCNSHSCSRPTEAEVHRPIRQ